MPRKRRLIPRVAAAGAIRDKLCLVQKRGGQAAIGTAVKIVHVVNALTGVAMYEEP
jgi:hypothetical protein